MEKKIATTVATPAAPVPIVSWYARRSRWERVMRRPLRGVRSLMALTVLTALVVLAAAAATARADVVWLCKPGQQDNPCHESLETTIYNDDGSSRVETPARDEDPPIDCFYVYPTVSGQATINANKNKDDELYAIARYQAARFSTQCKVYAPVYRQTTLLSINAATQEQKEQGGKIAYGDVREAWRDYLAHDNHGRPFVLIGHSQGTRHLRQLIREEIDPKPEVRSRLVSALLLGGNVLVRKGQNVGGDFAHIPACERADQLGCVIAYSTFNEAPPSNSRFGRSPASDTTGAGFPAGPDYEVLCTNPASLGANARTPLTSILRSEPFPGLIGALLVEMYGGPPPSAPTPYLIPNERYSARCEHVADANVLMIESIGNARKLNPAPDPTWGLHLADVNIALGELVGVVAKEAQAVVRAESKPAAPATRPRAPRLGLRLTCVRHRLRARVVGPDRRAIRRAHVWRRRGRVIARVTLRDGRTARLSRAARHCR